MKIDADLNQIMPGRWNSRLGKGKRAGIKSGNAPAKTLSGPVLRDASPTGASLRAAEGRISEALSIAQMAHSVIQQAMVISSRLRSMAMDAIASKRINADELAAIHTGMQTTLGEFAGRFNILAIPPEIRNIPAAGKPGAGAGEIKMTDIQDELKKLSDAVADVNRGNAADISRLSEISSGLAAKSETLSGWIDNLSGDGLRIAGAYSSDITPVELQKRISGTAEMIQGNFDTALHAQGNLSREKLAALIRE